MNHRSHAMLPYRRFWAVGANVRSALRRPACILAAALCLLAPSPASASIPGGMSFPHASAPVFNWAEPMEVQLSGVPVIVRGFVATLSLEQAAKAIARHEKRFQRVTTLPGSILLSGVHAGRHWVAQIEAAQGRVRGMVSALPLDLAAAPRGPGPGFLAPWLTQNARFVFSQSSSARGQTEVQSIHIPSRSLDGFMDDLNRRMAETGWRRAGVHSWTAGAAGKRPGSRRVDVFPVPASGGGRDAVLVSEFQ